MMIPRTVTMMPASLAGRPVESSMIGGCYGDELSLLSRDA